MLAYALTTFTDLIDRSDYINLEKKFSDKYDYKDFNFSKADGFAVAAGIQFYDPEDGIYKS